MEQWRLATVILALMFLAIAVRLAGADAGLVQERQACLNVMGYNAGRPDGVVGRQTGEAYAAYMRKTFGYGWPGVPPGTWIEIFERDCLAAYEAHQARQQTLPMHSQ